MENENKDVAEETKKENKEEIKEEIEEEIKEATKEETKEETTKEETKEETNDKPKKSKKGLWIGFGILVVLLVAYGVGAFYYHSHFLYIPRFGNDRHYCRSRYKTGLAPLLGQPRRHRRTNLAVVL